MKENTKKKECYTYFARKKTKQPNENCDDLYGEKKGINLLTTF